MNICINPEQFFYNRFKTICADSLQLPKPLGMRSSGVNLVEIHIVYSVTVYIYIMYNHVYTRICIQAYSCVHWIRYLFVYVCVYIQYIHIRIFTRIAILLAPLCSAFYDGHIRRYILHTTLYTFDLTSNRVHVKACERQFWRLSVSQTESGNRLHLCKVATSIWNMNHSEWISMSPWESFSDVGSPCLLAFLTYQEWCTESKKHPNQTALIPDEPRSLRWGQDFVVSLPLNQP